MDMWRFENIDRDSTYADSLVKMREQIQVVRDAQEKESGCGTILFYEYRPTVTITRSTGMTSLLSSTDDMCKAGLDVIDTDRGGDITFHGPGQLVGYPIVRLSPVAAGDKQHRVYDLLGYVRWLEERLISALASLGVDGLMRLEGYTGVWRATQEQPEPRKIVQIGVGVNSRGITRHGFAINNDMDFEQYFQHIVPCGISDRPVSDLRREGFEFRLEDIYDAVKIAFEHSAIKKPDL